MLLKDREEDFRSGLSDEPMRLAVDEAPKTSGGLPLTEYNSRVFERCHLKNELMGSWQQLSGAVTPKVEAQVIPALWPHGLRQPIRGGG